jgi:hypothetical protein
MYQTGREASEAVSNDCRSSVSKDAFKKALSVTLTDFVLRTEAALMQAKVEEFHQLCNFHLLLGVRVNSLPGIQCRGGCLSRSLHIYFRPMGPQPPRPPPIIAVDQFRPATLQLPHLKSFVAWHRISHLISSNNRRQSTVEPSPTTDRSNSRFQYKAW